ncbi:MAG: 50S ribosomal protein L28 [Tenuifilum sp.]|uniref:50S ribosomal protein L28 n=1 Tax=Tenuifilum TaxID=2760873 RepID=UPI00175C48A5|nr:50S ribosomal protein L28 [Bacteroidales bacterium]HOK60354.1 50S ribosomal protein L28 [Tenuifilum sp.]MBP7169798.1 50S ribosomal protein L28 [Bacteroidales bacterium]MBP9029236.1 50S ribosomal protein L28 [Bacteroidales bacterium]HOK85204.1 50S ribosomal protein L28 [Tenuifilum sp.]
MSRVCQLTGKRVMVGNNVSHSKRRTKRRFLPNLKTKRLFLESENRWVTLRLSTSAMRTIDKVGLDNALKKFAKKGHI